MFYWKVVPEILGPDWVENAVEDIAAMADDPEAAHSAEDELHQFVLEKISKGECRHIRLCAELALKSLELKFSRWYA